MTSGAVGIAAGATGAQSAWRLLQDSGQDSQAKSDHSASLPSVIVTDIRMPMMNGLDFSSKIKQAFAQIPVIIMTAHADVQSAVDSYQSGAFDYLPKPFELDDAIAMVKKACLQSQSNQTQKRSKSKNYNDSLIRDAQFGERQALPAGVVTHLCRSKLFEPDLMLPAVSHVKLGVVRRVRWQVRAVTVVGGVRCRSVRQECFFGRKEAQKAVCPLLLTGMLRRALAAASRLVEG